MQNCLIKKSLGISVINLKMLLYYLILNLTIFSEWNGRFSDRSDEWTEESRRLCNVTDADDGIFWMPIEDYC